MKSSDGSRILNGSALMVGGVFKTVGGTILTAASIPATSEVIGVAGIGAGTVTAFSGKSDLQQGYEEIRLGIKGDTSTETVNEMCARLYDGNSTIYHESTGIAAMAGMELIPYVPLKGQTPMRAEPGTVAKNAARDTSDAALGSAAETVDTAAIKSAGTEVGGSVGSGAATESATLEEIVGSSKPSTGVESLLNNRSELTGTTGEKLLSTVQNPELAKIINELYRPGATIGDGGTASILMEEFRNGSSKHLIKAMERLRQLRNLSTSGKLGLNDLDVVDELINDLEDAIKLFN